MFTEWSLAHKTKLLAVVSKAVFRNWFMEEMKAVIIVSFTFLRSSVSQEIVVSNWKSFSYCRCMDSQ